MYVYYECLLLIVDAYFKSECTLELYGNGGVWPDVYNDAYKDSVWWEEE